MKKSQPLLLKEHSLINITKILVTLMILMLLVACSDSNTLKKITTAQEDNEMLYSEEDIDNAILQIADDVTVVPVTVGEVIPDGVVITTDDNGEEDSLTTLLDVNNLSGYVCNIINNTNGRNKWRIQSINTADESALGLFAVKQDGRAMQSIGCNAQGNKAVFSMKTSSSADYEVFLLDFSGTTRQAYQLTSNSKNDIDVSMSADGSILVWQSWIGSDKVITIREYASDGTFSDTVLDGPVPYVEPSINSTGTFITFIDIHSNKTNLLRHNLNNGNTGSVYSTSGKRSLSHPSVSNNGRRVAWMEGLNDENFKVKDMPTNTIIEMVSNNSNLDHGFLADDGMSVVYSINRADKAFTKVKNVDDGTIKNVGRVLNPPARYRGSVWVERGATCGDNTGTHTGDLTLTTQAEVNAFLTNGVGKIDGDLILNPSADLDFSPLNLLNEITGSLKLEDNIVQTTLASFDCLTTVMGTDTDDGIIIEDNTALASLEGFPKLATIGRDLNISLNPMLSSIPEFSKLTAIQNLGDLKIEGNNALTTITGFPKLVTIGRSLIIEKNPKLVHIPEFPELTAIQSQFGSFSLSIEENDALTTIIGFPQLVTVNGTLYIRLNPMLSSIPEFPELIAIRNFGDLFIEGNDTLTTITGFPKLATIGDDMRIINNVMLTNTPVFPELTAIQNGSLLIEENNALITINAFPKLAIVDSFLSIKLNPMIGSIPLFQELTTIREFDLIIEENNKLTSITGFPKLATVGDDLSIINNAMLTSISGFNLLGPGSIPDVSTVSNNPMLDCQNPVPNFSPVDVSSGNFKNCP